jgi:hypothetical protein
MSRIILNSNNSLVIIGESPSFKEENETGVLFAGVNGSSFTCSLQREKSAAIGSRDYQLNHINTHPEIELEIQYLYNPLMVNESLLGLGISTGLNYKPTGFIDQLADKSSNFYFYNHPDQGSDAVEYFKSQDLNTPNDGEIYSFGNAYLSNYQVSFSEGSIPSVSTSYKCSNMQGDIYTGNIKSPAINLDSGNSNGVGDLVVSGTVLSGFDPISNQYFDNTDPDLHSTSCGLVLNLSNIQVGGQRLDEADHRITSMSMSIPIPRVDLNGIGSDYVRSRKIKYPIEGSLSFQSNVSNYETGFVSGLLANEEKYAFSFICKNIDQNYASILRFKDLILNDFSYSMEVNENMQYSCSFSFPINDSKDFNFWATEFRDTKVFDSSNNVINQTSTDIPGHWQRGDLDAARLELGTAASSIGSEAFSGCSNITGGLTIPDFTDNIGEAAFKDCNGFEGDLYIHDSMPEIGKQIFYDCSGFDGSLYLGESLSSIGREAFYNCTGLNGNLVVPNGISTIGREAFANCSGFKSSLTIAKQSVTTIGSDVFSGCQFNELILDQSTNIVNATDFDKFSDFDVLLTFADYTTGINDDAFNNYDITGYLLMPPFLEKIGDRAFSNNTGLNSYIFIDEEVKSIGSEAFYNCSNLTGDLTIPNSVTDLGPYSFAGAQKLGPNLYYSNSITIIDSGVFSGCSSFTGDLTIEDYVSSVGDAAFLDCSGYNGKITIFGPKTIAKNAFDNTNFKTLILKAIQTVNNGDLDAFKDIPLSLEIGQETKNINESSFDGFNFTGTLDLNNVDVLGNNCFSGCDGFTGSLTINDNVTGLGSSSFMDCNGFNGSLYISQSISDIKKETFSNCGSLDGGLLIRDNISGIGEKAFFGCSGFDFLDIQDGGVTGIFDQAFYDCTGFTGLNLNSGLTYIGQGAFAGCENIPGDLVIPEEVYELGEDAFSGCVSFDGQLDLPCNLTGFPVSALSGCTGFKSIRVGKDTEIQDQFTGIEYGFKNLTVKFCGNTAPSRTQYDFYKPIAKRQESTITFEEGVTSFPSNSWTSSSIALPWYFTGELKIPNSCESIGTQAFRLTKFNSIDLGTGVQTIGLESFQGSFTRGNGTTGTLRIPDSCKTIGEEAFESNGFQKIILGNGVTGIGRESFWGLNYVSEDFEIPKQLKVIDDTSFYRMGQLMSTVSPAVPPKFILPEDNSLEFIGLNAFRDIKQSNGWAPFDGDTVYFPNLRTVEGAGFIFCDIFDGCNISFDEKYTGVFEIEGNAFYQCGFTGNMTLPKKANLQNNCFFNNKFDGYLKGPASQNNGSPNIVYNAFSNSDFHKLIVPDYVEIISGLTDSESFNTTQRGYSYYEPFADQSSIEFESTSNVKVIDDWAFNGFSFTGDLRLPRSLSHIGHDAFADNTQYQSIRLQQGDFYYESGTAAIDSGAFRDCGSTPILESFPSVWEGDIEPLSGSGYIHPLAFTGCSFNNLTISQDVLKVATGDFDYFWPYSNVGGASLSFGNSLKNIKPEAFANKNLTGDLTFRPGFTRVQSLAFSGCSNLSGSLNISEPLNIGANVFEGTNFSEINLQNGKLSTDSSVQTINEGDYIIFEDAATNLSLNTQCTLLGQSAFSGYNLSGSLSIPNSITGLGNNTFANCSLLTGDLNLGCNIDIIGDNAFSGCAFSGHLAYGSSGSFGNSVFEGSFFTGLVIPQCTRRLESNSLDFYKNEGFDETSVLIFDEGLQGGVTGLGDNLFSGFGFSGSLELPSTLVDIGKASFADCTGFAGDLSIGDSVKDIADEAFFGSNNLNGLFTMNGGALKSIGKKSFAMLDGLSGGLYLPYSVEQVGPQSFESCSGLGPILEISQNMRYIKNQTFKNCTGITRMEGFNNNSNIRIVESESFLNCSNITGSIAFGPSVTGIGSLCLQGCTSMNNVYLDTVSSQVASNAFSSGPTGNIYVSEAVSGTYGSTFAGMDVLYWSEYPTID